MKACFGLLIMTDVMRSSGEALAQMWSESLGRPLLRATMTLRRFKVYLECARFDDKTAREERIKNDKLAAIREVFDKFAHKCAIAYNSSPYQCVDESLVGFRGRCPFRVYVPTKPDKYGIKLWSLCANGTHYLCNVQVYLRKQGPTPETKKQGARVVKELAINMYGSGNKKPTIRWD